MRDSVNRAALAFAFIVLATSLYFMPLASWISELVQWGHQHPLAAPAAYVFFVVVATVLFLPGSIAMMVGGFLFGFLPGFLYAVIAVPAGAQGAFEFGRWVARPWISKRVAHNQRMQALEAALREEAFVIVVLSRLSLIIPFNLLNYAYGTTSIKAATHMFATALGMLPAIAIYVYLGTLAHDLGQILSGDAAPTELGYWILGAGIIAIVATTWVIHRSATRALEKHLLEQESSR